MAGCFLSIAVQETSPSQQASGNKTNQANQVAPQVATKGTQTAQMQITQTPKTTTTATAFMPDNENEKGNALHFI